MQCFEELADLEEDCPACCHENRQTLDHLRSLDNIESDSKPQLMKSQEYKQDSIQQNQDFGLSHISKKSQTFYVDIIPSEN